VAFTAASILAAQLDPDGRKVNRAVADRVAGTLASRSEVGGRSREVDVLIVGARIAGSILATVLGQSGWSVLVVDRSTFPSTTLSTHFFRGSGCAGALRQIDMLAEVLGTGAPPLVREYNADAVTGTHTIDPPQGPGDIGFNLSVMRITLDGMLVERARREPTVELLEGTSLRGLTFEGGRVIGGHVADGSSSTEVRARLVVGADGYGSRVASLVGAPIQEDVAPARAMYYRYLEGLIGPEGEPDGPEFSLADDELVYVFPSDAGVACIALSIDLSTYRRMHERPGAAFAERVAAHPFIAPRLEEGAWTGRLWGCGPRSSQVRVPVGPGWALVGDASMHQDPWTGLGMDNAAKQAVFLGEALDDLLAGRTSEGEALRTYHHRRDEDGLPGFRETARLGANLNAFRDA
jgi:flavin-dependent dehydrogenase